MSIEQLKSEVNELESKIKEVEYVSGDELIIIDSRVKKLESSKAKPDIGFDVVHVDVSEIDDMRLGDIWLLHQSMEQPMEEGITIPRLQTGQLEYIKTEKQLKNDEMFTFKREDPSAILPYSWN